MRSKPLPKAWAYGPAPEFDPKRFSGLGGKTGRPRGRPGRQRRRRGTVAPAATASAAPRAEGGDRNGGGRRPRPAPRRRQERPATH
ncbi:MAG: hypothetical protein WKG07_42490 [Hymenobacter sp.]